MNLTVKVSSKPLCCPLLLLALPVHPPHGSLSYYYEGTQLRLTWLPRIQDIASRQLITSFDLTFFAVTCFVAVWLGE